MKILIYSDVHISQDSSIVKSFGEKYSIRLEHIIKSLDWAENLAVEKGCKYIFNLGDTFDKPIINAMEATAIQDVKWAPIQHYVLVGNHDSNVASLEYSSVSILKTLGFEIVTEVIHLLDHESTFTFIPYILESNRKPLKEYLLTDQDIVLSHNDIAGFSFGGFLSKEGFQLDEIKNGCKLFLNGHLHNSDYLAKNILNVGNLCGQNFSEDAFRYKHGAWILDTETDELTFFENPYALNFYKIEYGSTADFAKIKNNSVLSIKCETTKTEQLKTDLEKYKDKVVATCITQYEPSVTVSDTTVRLEKVDHLKQFSDFVHERIGNNDIINNELAEVCK